MSFIKVTAEQCNSQGLTAQISIRSEFHLNTDLIGAINGKTIYLKGGDIVNLGGNYYKNFALGTDQRIPLL